MNRITCQEQIEFAAVRPDYDCRSTIDRGNITTDFARRPSEWFGAGHRGTVREYLDHAAWAAEATSGAHRHRGHGQYATSGRRPA